MEEIVVDSQDDIHMDSDRACSPELGVGCVYPDVPSPSSGQENSMHSTPSKGSKDSGGCKKRVPETPTTGSAARKKLSTSEKIAKAKERDQKRAEREKDRLEKQQKKEEEQRQKEEKKKKAEEERKQKEAERLKQKEEKEAEKRRKELQKTEEKQKKDAERMAKDEEKRKREAERVAKEEERKKKEEEKLKKEEVKRAEEEKKKKAREAQANFLAKFVKVEKKEIVELPESKGSTLFLPYEIQKGVHLAPRLRRTLSEEEQNVLSAVLAVSDEILCEPSSLYLQELKSGIHLPGKCSATLKPSKIDIQILHPQDASSRIKLKLIQFSDSNRPPFYGTKNYEGIKLRPRNPLAEYDNLDYEFNSDSEWEDCSDAESLSNSEKEDSDEEADEDDREFIEEDVEEEGEGDELSAEAAFEKKKVETVVQRWIKKRKKLLHASKQVIGPCWLDMDCPPALAACTAIQLYDPVQEEAGKVVVTHETLEYVNQIPVAFMPYIVKALHLSNASQNEIAQALSDLMSQRDDEEAINRFPAKDDKIQTLLKSFELGKWSTRLRLKKAISTIAEWRKKNSGWYVREEVRALYGVLEGEEMANPCSYRRQPTAKVAHNTSGVQMEPEKGVSELFNEKVDGVAVAGPSLESKSAVRKRRISKLTGNDSAATTPLSVKRTKKPPSTEGVGSASTGKLNKVLEEGTPKQKTLASFLWKPATGNVITIDESDESFQGAETPTKRLNFENSQ